MTDDTGVPEPLDATAPRRPGQHRRPSLPRDRTRLWVSVLSVLALGDAGLIATAILGSHHPHKPASSIPARVRSVHALLTERGEGPSVARSFTTSAQRWTITYTYRCSTTRQSDTYSTLPALPTAESFRLSLANAGTGRTVRVVSTTASSGTAKKVLTGAGTYVIAVAATPDCSWTLSVSS